MKNFKYLFTLFLFAFIVSYFVVSCSNFTDNNLEYEDLIGKVFISEEGNKIIFKKDIIYLYYNENKFIISGYSKVINNMIILKTDDITFEDESLNIYLLKDNSIYFTLDNSYYWC